MDGWIGDGRRKVLFKSKETIFFVTDLLIMGIRSESFTIFDLKLFDFLRELLTIFK